ncbi:hypothetical protein DXG01_001279 [Tephrocybe rancida]|nr:hypothetical protein DXG01_001279 [Tephrocybe rancida]
MTAYFVYFLLAGSSAFLVARYWPWQRKRGLPPGPKGWPIVGNLFDMPKETMWHTFAEWGKTYGDISSVTVFGQPIIVLNSVKVAQEMLTEKGAIYSDRPQVSMGGEMIGWKNALPLMRYGKTFQHYRRMFHRLFGTHDAMKVFHKTEALSVQRFLRDILQAPHDFVPHLKKHIGTVSLRLTYGYDVTEGNDRFVHLLDNGMKQFAIATAPGAFLVDLIPALRHIPSWVPGGGFHNKAKIWAQNLNDMVTEPYSNAKANLAKISDARHCFISTFLTPDLDAHNEFNVKWTAGTIAAGGFSTVRISTFHSNDGFYRPLQRLSFLQVFFLTMSLHPDIQRQAQAEVDAVVGSRRFPTPEDREELPFINALCREVFRFHSVVPTGLPHVVMEDDFHNGFFILKGSIVIANIWNMLHDPETYSDPEIFNPSRFISTDGHEAERDVYDFIYGFGRRVCPGRVLADTSLFIMATMALAVFDISKSADKDGTIVEPILKPLSGSVRIRSPEAFSLLMSEEEDL